MNAFLKKLARFVREEDGLVTIEWVAIAAGASVAAIAITGVIYTQLGTQSQNIPSNLCANASTAISSIPGAGALAQPCTAGP